MRCWSARSSMFCTQGADKSLAGVAAFLSNPDETIENTL